MKLTLLALGSTGDVRPYIILAAELQRRGHEITLAAFSRFESNARQAGIPFFPLSGDAESFIASVMAPNTNAITFLPKIRKNLKSYGSLLIQDIVSSCSQADAMVCNYFGTVYYSVAELLDIPCVQTHFFPMDPTGDTPISSVRHQHLSPSVNKASYRAGYLLIGLLESSFLTEWRKNNGLNIRHPHSLPDYHIGNHRIQEIYAISPSVFPRPPEWDSMIHMSGFWFDEYPAPWNPPSDLLEFLSGGKPPLYFGFGLMNGGNMEGFFDTILRVLRKSGQRAVICNGWSEQREKSDDRVFFADYIPHDWLFSKVSAVVHHGGAGTTSAGLRFGKPSLIIPFAGDQSFWASLVEKSGCGPKPVFRSRLTEANLQDALQALTANPEYDNNANKISALLAKEHGTSTAADLIEKAVREW